MRGVDVAVTRPTVEVDRYGNEVRVYGDPTHTVSDVLVAPGSTAVDLDGRTAVSKFPVLHARFGGDFIEGDRVAVNGQDFAVDGVDAWPDAFRGGSAALAVSLKGVEG